MRFQIKEIGDDGLVVDVPLTEAWLAEECPGVEATLGRKGLRLRGTLTMVGDDVFLRGTVSGEMKSTCVRCLEEARLPVSIPLLTTFVEASDDEEDEEDDANDDVDVATYDGDEIDLAPEVRDQLILTLPLHPLCREDCRGLCPVCGVNRNNTSCKCEEKARESASPLAGLRNIKLSD